MAIVKRTNKSLTKKLSDFYIREPHTFETSRFDVVRDVEKEDVDIRYGASIEGDTIAIVVGAENEFLNEYKEFSIDLKENQGIVVGEAIGLLLAELLESYDSKLVRFGQGYSSDWVYLCDREEDIPYSWRVRFWFSDDFSYVKIIPKEPEKEKQVGKESILDSLIP
jgi:hypothetical protein